MKVAALWNRFSFLGVQPQAHRQQQRTVLLTNRLSIVLFVINALAAISLVVIWGWSAYVWMVLLSNLFFVLVLLLNHKGHSDASRLFLCLYVPISTLIITLIFKINSEQVEELSFYTSRVVMLFTATLPLILFMLREQILLFFGLTVNALCLLLYDTIHNMLGVGYYHFGFSSEGYPFFKFIILMLYFLLVAGLLYYKKELEAAERELWESNLQLRHFYAELGMQNEEINAQSEKLQESQQQLQEANQLIEQQKELLENENQQLQQHLLEKNRILETSNRELHNRLEELRQFSYTISHNLRGPVASLLGLASLFDLEKADPHNRELMQCSKTAASALDMVIRDLSQVLQIREGKEPQELIDLEYMLQNVLIAVKHEKGVEPIHTEIALRVRKIRGVKPYLHSIFYNLISNAIKYRHPNRPCSITIRSRVTETGVLLKVRDNGLGINLDKHGENLFKMYKRFNENRDGRGLGLYLIKTQAEILGGFVDVKSKPGEGSTFSVWLPQPAFSDEEESIRENIHNKA